MVEISDKTDPSRLGVPLGVQPGAQLGAFQAAFLAALDRGEDAAAPWVTGPLAAAGLRVHRNTAAAGAAQALAAAFPVVQSLVGEAWFSAAALAYGQACPPTDPVLAHYGETFADWLESFEPALALPYLPAMARLDRLWMRSYLAPDAPALTAQDLATDAESGSIGAHTAAGWARFDWNAVSLWRALKANEEPCDVEAVPEIVLFTRPGIEVMAQTIAPALADYLDALAGGRSAEEATDALLRAAPDEDPLPLLARLIAAGALMSLS